MSQLVCDDGWNVVDAHEEDEVVSWLSPLRMSPNLNRKVASSVLPDFDLLALTCGTLRSLTTFLAFDYRAASFPDMQGCAEHGADFYYYYFNNIINIIY